VKVPKMIGIVAIAAIAMTVLGGAGTASASQFRAEEYPVSISGEAASTLNQVIETHAGKAQCKMAPTGNLSAASSSLTISPNYSGCRAFGFFNATVVMNSCSYVLKSTTESAPYLGTLSISCTKEADKIEIKTITCTVSLPAQTPAGNVVLENGGSPPHGAARTVSLAINLTGVKYTVGSSCPNGSGSFEDGTYTGTSQPLKASNGTNQVGFYVANSQIEQPPVFSSSAFPYTVEATNTGPLVVGNWGSTTILKCTSLTGTAKPTTWTSDYNLAATWKGCSAPGVPSATVAMNSCTLQTHLSKWSGTTAATGTLGISCEKAGDAMVFSYNGGCKSSWPAQAGEPVKFEVVGSGSEQHITVSEPSAYNMTYTLSGCQSGTYNNGAILGSWNLVGKSGSGLAQAIWLE
jgi:hypothetical protein